MSYRIVPVTTAIAEEVRTTRKAPGYGHPAHGDLARGYGPCRTCLRPFEAGVDRRVLFTYDPFQGIETLPLPGPIYVHEAACAPYDPVDRYPDALRFIPATLNAYRHGRILRGVAHVEPHGDVDSAIRDLLMDPRVDYVHVRNTEAGCYMFRIDRVADPAGGERG